MNKYNFNDCAENIKHKEITFKENKSKFTIYNPNEKEVLKVTIDGCVIKDTKGNNVKKCDYLAIDTNENNAHFIELKGKDIDTAIEQLINTIKIITSKEKNYLEKDFKKIFTYVCSSNVPQGTNTQKITKKIKRVNNNIEFSLSKETKI